MCLSDSLVLQSSVWYDLLDSKGSSDVQELRDRKTGKQTDRGRLTDRWMGMYTDSISSMLYIWRLRLMCWSELLCLFFVCVSATICNHCLSDP